MQFSWTLVYHAKRRTIQWAACLLLSFNAFFLKNKHSNPLLIHLIIVNQLIMNFAFFWRSSTLVYCNKTALWSSNHCSQCARREKNLMQTFPFIHINWENISKYNFLNNLLSGYLILFTIKIHLILLAFQNCGSLCTLYAKC